MTQRVAITGLGCVSGLGQGVPVTWDRVRRGEGAIRPLSRVLAGDERFTIEGSAAWMDGFNGEAVESFAQRNVFGHLDPVATYAILATHEALQDGGLLETPGSLQNAAIIYGGATGGNITIEDAYARLFLNLQRNTHPMTIPRYMGSASVGQLSMLFGVRGPAFAISSACASSAHAIAEAAHMIRAGRTKIAITGGADASISYGSWLGWKSLQAMAADTCRPFSKGRKGMVLGEGAATLILEDLDHARARGAHIYGEIIGTGASSDAFHLTHPDGEGAMSAVRAAYEDAQLRPDEPAMISTHGTGTPVNDKVETQVIRQVCGTHLDRHAVFATKSAHGHLLGAGGALEFLLGICALEAGCAPPILNFLESDPDCDLPLVVGAARDIDAGVLVSNSFAFGGLNSVLIARRAMHYSNGAEGRATAASASKLPSSPDDLGTHR